MHDWYVCSMKSSRQSSTVMLFNLLNVISGFRFPRIKVAPIIRKLGCFVGFSIVRKRRRCCCCRCCCCHCCSPSCPCCSCCCSLKININLYYRSYKWRNLHVFPIWSSVCMPCWHFFVCTYVHNILPDQAHTLMLFCFKVQAVYCSGSQPF